MLLADLGERIQGKFVRVLREREGWAAGPPSGLGSSDPSGAGRVPRTRSGTWKILKAPASPPLSAETPRLLSPGQLRTVSSPWQLEPSAPGSFWRPAQHGAWGSLLNFRGCRGGAPGEGGRSLMASGHRQRGPEGEHHVVRAQPGATTGGCPQRPPKPPSGT